MDAVLVRYPLPLEFNQIEYNYSTVLYKYLWITSEIFTTQIFSVPLRIPEQDFCWANKIKR
jgi:hypothetical protein